MAIAIIIPLFIKTDYNKQILVITLLYAFWACSWNIIGGLAGQLALGNGVYIGIGAYVVAILLKYEFISPWFGMIIAGIIAGVISIIISYPCFKLKGIYYALATAAMLHVIRIIFSEENEIFGYNTGAAMGIKIPWRGGSFVDMQFESMLGYYYLALGLLIAVLLITSYIMRSKMGYYLLSINTNQDAASSLGVNVTLYKLYAQFISAFLTAVGGAVYCMLLQFVDPNTVFAYDLSTTILLLAIVGGRGTLWGPVLGSFLMIPIEQIFLAKFGGQIAGLSTVLYGTVLMFVVLFLPQGLVTYVKTVTSWIKNKVFDGTLTFS